MTDFGFPLAGPTIRSAPIKCVRCTVHDRVIPARDRVAGEGRHDVQLSVGDVHVVRRIRRHLKLVVSMGHVELFLSTVALALTQTHSAPRQVTRCSCRDYLH